MTPKKVPMRKCIGCKEMKDKRQLLRVVKSCDGVFQLDPTLKQQGRGAYVCNNPKCFESARKNKGFERSFKSRVPQEIYETLKVQMENK